MSTTSPSAESYNSDENESHNEVQTDEASNQEMRRSGPLSTGEAWSIMRNFKDMALSEDIVYGYWVDDLIEHEGDFYYQVQGYEMYEKNGTQYYDRESPVGNAYYVDIYSGEIREIDSVGPQTIVSMPEAEALAYEALGEGDPRNLFVCEGLSVLWGDLKYKIRFFNMLPDHRATVGWYYVDVYTGEIISELSVQKGEYPKS